MSDRLPIPVKRALREPWDESRLDAAWRRRQLAPARPRSAALPLAAAAGLALAATGALGWWASATPAGPLTLADGSAPRAIRGSAEVALSDGSTLSLGDAAELDVLENDGRAFGLLLHRGEVELDVVPGGPRRWTIECGLAMVAVVGTRFTIERAAERLAVSVERGAVLVTGERVPDRARRLGPGESIEIVAAPPEAPAAEAAAVPEHEAPAPEVASPPVVRPSVPAGARWRALAERGEYDGAYVELGPGGVGRASARASADELLALADVARLSGHAAEAVEPLERLLADHPRDPNAALAAFTLGRVEADSLGHPDRAARAFERSIDLGIPSALRPDALARLARARSGAGDAAGAREAADRYLAESPEGRHAPAMRELAGAPER
jgi:transmembrane sensor